MTHFNSRVSHVGQLTGVFQGTPSIRCPTPLPVHESGVDLPPRPPGLVVADLTALRDEILSETTQYAQRDGAKQSYLDRCNKQLHQLSDSIDSLQRIRHHDLWADLDAEWQDMRRIDPSLDSIIIRLDWCPNPSRTASIYRDLSYRP